MKTSLTAFSTKAENYARYRWAYAAEAVDAFFTITGLGREASLADIGAGTGKLTCQLAGRLGRIYAVEPNPEMAAQAEKTLAGFTNCAIVLASAEATGLPDRSVDAITVAEAAHWFDFQPARDEMRRILKPGGWLALWHNAGADSDRGAAMKALYSPEYGVAPRAFPLPPVPWERYFEGGSFQKVSFPFERSEGWEEFIGSLLSTSYVPDADHPLYPKFEQAAREVFACFSVGGRLEVHGVTELMVGKMGE